MLSVALLLLATSAAATSEGVLVIHSNQRATPAAIVIETTLGKVVPEALQRPVQLYSEYLDIEWASTETYAAAQAEFLRQKYAGRNIRVIVASAPAALGFVIRFRDQHASRCSRGSCRGGKGQSRTGVASGGCRWQDHRPRSDADARACASPATERPTPGDRARCRGTRSRLGAATAQSCRTIRSARRGRVRCSACRPRMCCADLVH